MKKGAGATRRASTNGTTWNALVATEALSADESPRIPAALAANRQTIEEKELVAGYSFLDANERHEFRLLAANFKSVATALKS